MLPGCRQVTNVLHDAETLPKISIGWVGCTNVTDGRQTDGRTTTYSEREHEFTFAKNRNHCWLRFYIANGEFRVFCFCDLDFDPMIFICEQIPADQKWTFYIEAFVYYRETGKHMPPKTLPRCFEGGINVKHDISKTFVNLEWKRYQQYRYLQLNAYGISQEWLKTKSNR